METLSHCYYANDNCTVSVNTTCANFNETICTAVQPPALARIRGAVKMTWSVWYEPASDDVTPTPLDASSSTAQGGDVDEMDELEWERLNTSRLTEILFSAFLVVCIAAILICTHRDQLAVAWRQFRERRPRQANGGVRVGRREDGEVKQNARYAQVPLSVVGEQASPSNAHIVQPGDAGV